MANPVVTHQQNPHLPSPESGGPIQGQYRNLVRLFHPIDQINIEMKKGALAALPDEMRERIYNLISTFYGYREENLDSARAHLFGFELPLQLTIHNIFSSIIFKNLNPDQKEKIQRILRPHAFDAADLMDEIEFKETGIALDILGDLENEPQDPFIKKELLKVTMNRVWQKKCALNFIQLLFDNYSPNKQSFDKDIPVIFFFFKYIMILSDTIHRDPSSVKQLMSHLSSSEHWQRSGISFNTINDLFLKNQFKPQIIKTNILKQKVTIVDTMIFINFTFIFSIYHEYKESRKGNEISLLLDIVNFIKSNIFINEESQMKLIESYFHGPCKTESTSNNINYIKHQIKSAPEMMQEVESLLNQKNIELLLGSQNDFLGHNAIDDIARRASLYHSSMKFFRELVPLIALLSEAYSGAVNIALPPFCSNDGLEKFLSYYKKEIDKSLQTNYTDYEKIFLNSIIERYFNRLKKTDQNLENNLSGIISEEKLSYYYKSFSTDSFPYCQIIYAPRGNSAQEVLSAYRKFFNYGKLNKIKYQDYLFRLEEISSFVYGLISQTKKDLFILQNISAFIKKGDLKELFRQLAETANLEEQDTLFFEAISHFSQENGSPPPSEDLLEKILKQRIPGIYLKLVDIPEMLITLLDAFTKNSSFYTRYLFQGADYFEPYIQSTVASLYSPSSSLQIDPKSSQPFLNSSKKADKKKKSESKKSSKKPDQKKKGKEKAIASQQSSSSSSAIVSKEDLIGCALSPSSSSQSSSSSQPSQSIRSASTPTIESRLQGAKERLCHYFENLMAIRSPHTRMALKDSQEHLDLLLAAMRHLHSSINSQHFSNQALFAFINDCIRHSTLGVEQLLVALYRETNAIQSREEMFPGQIASHDLLQLLDACNLKHGDLSSSCRKWIQKINRAEVILRHRNQSRRENVVLNILLEKRDQLLKGSQDPRHLIQALCDYLLPLEDFLTSIQPLFSLNPDSSRLISFEIKDLISDVLTEIHQPLSFQDDGKAHISNPLLLQFSEIRKDLEAILSSDPSARFYGELDNIQNCLLVHLEEEIESQSELEPIQASLHLSNVILLNQQIIEALLHHLNFSRGVSLSFEELSQHNLLDLIVKIEFPLEKFSKEEMEFLKDIKQKRQLIRYPAFYTSQHGKKSFSPKIEEMRQLVASAKSLYSSQRADQDLKGFTSSSRNAAKDLEKIKNFTQKDTETMVSIMQKLISFSTGSLQT